MGRAVPWMREKVGAVLKRTKMRVADEDARRDARDYYDSFKGGEKKKLVHRRTPGFESERKTVNARRDTGVITSYRNVHNR